MQSLYFETKNTLLEGKKPRGDCFIKFEIRPVRDFMVPGEDVAGMHIIRENEQDLLEDDAENAAGPVRYGVFGIQKDGKPSLINDFPTIKESIEFLQRIGIVL